MNFTAKDVQALREKTGAGMMDCKKALTETDGDMDKAVDVLREKRSCFRRQEAQAALPPRALLLHIMMRQIRLLLW